jgi:hypothetical protein
VVSFPILPTESGLLPYHWPSYTLNVCPPVAVNPSAMDGSALIVIRNDSGEDSNDNDDTARPGG